MDGPIATTPSTIPEATNTRFENSFKSNVNYFLSPVYNH